MNKAGVVRIKLDKYLEQIGVSRYYLAKKSGIDYSTLDKYYKNSIFRFDSYILARICDALECDISDIVEYIK